MHQVFRWLRKAILRLGERTYLKVWDLLAALQSSKPLQSGFVLWTSPDDVSRRAPNVPLGPYLCVLQRKTLMEPRRGLLIADYGVLIETSVSNAYTARDPVLWEHLSSAVSGEVLQSHGSSAIPHGPQGGCFALHRVAFQLLPFLS